MAVSRQPPNTRRERLAHRAAGVLALLVLGVALVSCGGDGATPPGEQGKPSGAPSFQQAQRAQDRLDGPMTRSFNKANDVSAKPYACLRRSPSGGPALAACVSTCQVCATNMGSLKRKVKAAYAGSPRYVRSVYRAAYAAEVKNLDDRAAVLTALADYARVHGASVSAGMAEFDRSKALIKIEDASAARYLRVVTKARARFRRYLGKLD